MSASSFGKKRTAVCIEHERSLLGLSLHFVRFRLFSFFLSPCSFCSCKRSVIVFMSSLTSLQETFHQHSPLLVFLLFPPRPFFALLVCLFLFCYFRCKRSSIVFVRRRPCRKSFSQRKPKRKWRKQLQISNRSECTHPHYHTRTGLISSSNGYKHSLTCALAPYKHFHAREEGTRWITQNGFAPNGNEKESGGSD